MVESHWGDLVDRRVKYRDRTWELTGNVDVKQNGSLVAVEGRDRDDVKGRTAWLSFGLENPPNSLNPGNLGDHFNRLDREGDRTHLIVKREGRTYRYELQRLEYD